jgi:hypothetical protein
MHVQVAHRQLRQRHRQPAGPRAGSQFIEDGRQSLRAELEDFPPGREPIIRTRHGVQQGLQVRALRPEFGPELVLEASIRPELG